MNEAPANPAATRPALGTLYTLGYTAEGADQLVEDLLVLDVTIVDIRWWAASVRPRWDQPVLSCWLGGYYWHLPTLGNTRYARRGQPIILADPQRGIPKLVTRLQQGEPLALLCMCAEVERCHRRLVADLVRARLPGLRVIHLPTTSTEAHRRDDEATR